MPHTRFIAPVMCATLRSFAHDSMNRLGMSGDFWYGISAGWSPALSAISSLEFDW
jgi:hypothetical protein